MLLFNAVCPGGRTVRSICDITCVYIGQSVLSDVSLSWSNDAERLSHRTSFSTLLLCVLCARVFYQWEPMGLIDPNLLSRRFKTNVLRRKAIQLNVF